MSGAGVSFRKLRSRGRRGQALVEFAISALLVLVMIFAVVEFGRMLLVYTTVTDAARLGARYAITHGTVPGGTANVGAVQTQVQTIVKKFLAAGTVNTSAAGLSITTTFPALSCSGSPSVCSGTTAGNPVQVTVSYPYDVLVSYFPISVTLASTSEGVITW
jgi:Flp pilus assembly protein TadG